MASDGFCSFPALPRIHVIQQFLHHLRSVLLVGVHHLLATTLRLQKAHKRITRTCKNHQEPPRTNAILFVQTVQIIIGDNGHGSKLWYFGEHRIGWQMDVYPEKMTA